MKIGRAIMVTSTGMESYDRQQGNGSMSEHTPGPWTANLHHLQDYAGRTHAFIHATKPLVPLAAVVLAAEGCDDAEGRANAHLIAAAPDLLAAAQSAAALLMAYHKEFDAADYDPTWLALEAAIKKAILRADNGEKAREE